MLEFDKSLRREAEHFLQELEILDKSLQESYPGEIDKATRNHFHQRLIDFQKFNQEYIQNLNQSHGLIQFEFNHLSDEMKGELPPLSFLRKATPLPSHKS